MAKFSPDRPASGPVLEGVGPSGFRIDGAYFREGVLLTPDRAIAWDAPAIDALDMAMLEPVLDPAPEFVLLGTGTAMRRPPAAFTAALEARGIGLELMDSRAAARAWGVLRVEGRMIVAALMPLSGR